MISISIKKSSFMNLLRNRFTSLSNDRLHIKDEKIVKLNENMHMQTVNIKSLIPENIRLNNKLLPEKIGTINIGES